jgi:hypothetical protein
MHSPEMNETQTKIKRVVIYSTKQIERFLLRSLSQITTTLGVLITGSLTALTLGTFMHACMYVCAAASCMLCREIYPPQARPQGADVCVASVQG